MNLNLRTKIICCLLLYKDYHSHSQECCGNLLQQNSIATKFLLQQPIATDFSTIMGNIIFFIAIEVYCNNLKFIATKPPNAILKSVTVTYCNKKFVATNCINNIFCCNKVFLIIIKIFYCNQTLLQQNFYCNSLLP